MFVVNFRAAGELEFRASSAPWNPSGAVNSSLFCGFHRVLNSLKGNELDIVELAVDLLDLADLNILDDVPRLRIDRYRPARTLPFHAFHGAHERVAAGIAIGLLEGIIDEMHSMIAADREEVRSHARVGFSESIDIGAVCRRRVMGRIEMGRHRADHRIAHRR